MAPQTAPTHRTAKGAQRIHDLIVVAAEQFLEHGFDTVAVDDLIARVGGSRRNIYSHFGGKEGLFHAAMLHVCEEMAKPLDQFTIEGREPDEVLPTFGRELVRTALSPRTLAVHRILTNEGNRFPEIAQAMLAASYLKILDKLATWIAAHQAKPASKISTRLPARVLAEKFISMTSSDVKLRAIVGLVHPPLSDTEIDDIVSSAVHTFLYGVAVQPPREHNSQNG
ncbi:TetR/AcrR family transcriptional regulator [Dickeya chrysanthemi]|uniref:TetR/AcrR family transcriptional regulator n=1 Tax=Dickeya chrysanthemi TaxID=556 RepID=UPI0025A11CEE|nr:TetR/AcrR family transcriptional regulator [Dickeya chrysanthemi]WJM85564.1 TetR/AcrR family transcriptional regulator [Dickeya chrysanthemi]